MLVSLPLKIKKVISHDNRTNAPEFTQNGTSRPSAPEDLKTQ